MKKVYQKMFEEVGASDRLRQEVWNLTKQKRTAERKHFPLKVLVIAAVLILALTGTTLAAVGVPGTIQGWFTRQWAELSEKGMSEEQLALIDRLTQQVGVSDTCNGVTVTLDSVTSGDSSVWLLLKISGDIPLYEGDHQYYFDDADLTFSPELDSQDTPGGYSIDFPFSGVAEDGVLTMLVRQEIQLSGEDSLLNGCEMELRLGDLMYGDSADLEGEWVLPFTVEPVEGTALLSLDSTQIPARDLDTKEKMLLEIREVRVSSTDIRFIQTAEDQRWYPEEISLVLKDGTKIETDGGGSRWTEAGEWASVWYWQLPVDLSQAEDLRCGDTIIPLQ